MNLQIWVNHWRRIMFDFELIASSSKKSYQTPKKSSVQRQTFLLCLQKTHEDPENPMNSPMATPNAVEALLQPFFRLFFIALFCKFRIIFFRAQFESLLCNLNKVFNLTVEVDEMKWEEKVFSRRPTIVIFSSTSHEPTAVAQYLQSTTADLLATAVQRIRHMSPENTWRCASAIITTAFA